MPDERQPWHRQPWENDSQWMAFQTYLNMALPRSVDGAYRLYFAAKNGLQPGDESVAKKRAVGGWQNWSRGRTWTGKAIDGGSGWETRALAYDAHLARQLEAQREHDLIERQKQLVNDELQDYAAQLLRWREVWDNTRMHLRTASSRVKRKGENGQEQEVEVITAELNVDDWLKLARWRGLISEQGRRALNMPERIVQDQITGPDGKTAVIAVTKMDVDEL